jgi:hypothetical protein
LLVVVGLVVVRLGLVVAFPQVVRLGLVVAVLLVTVVVAVAFCVFVILSYIFTFVNW